MLQVSVVLAAVGIEVSGALLIGLERHEHPLERQRLIVKDFFAEDCAKLRAVAYPDLCQHGTDVPVGHLKGREQRQARLIMNRGRASVPSASAGGSLIDAV